MVDAYLPTGSTQQWAVTQMPQWTAGGHAAANWGGSTNAVTKDCPSNLVKDAAPVRGLHQYIQERACDRREAGHAGRRRSRAVPGRAWPGPACRSSRPAVPHFPGNINAQFSTYANKVPTNFEWSPWDTEFGNFVTTQMAAAAAGKESWSKVLTTTQSQLVCYAKSAGYSVSWLITVPRLRAGGA